MKPRSRERRGQCTAVANVDWVSRNRVQQDDGLTQDPLARFLLGLCQRRGWGTPTYECYREPTGYTCHVLVNGREYQTDLAYQTDDLARENAAMRAFMVCRNFSVNGGMLARNGIVQGLPADETNRKHRKGSHHTTSTSSTISSRHHSSHGHQSSHHGHHSSGRSRRSGHHSSGSSTSSSYEY